MELGDLLEGVPTLQIGPVRETIISSLAYDSRQIRPGGLFFAIQGEKTDGHRFIPQAMEVGAASIVSEREAPPEFAARWIHVPKIRRALASIARNFFGHPDAKLRLVGITGTNGKTTTAYLLESIFHAAGIRAGLFGTIEYRFGRRTLPALNTTPESLDLLGYLAELLGAGGQAAVMEVSSHALAQERVWGFRFSAAVFTNLTRDHLDYHKDFEGYFGAKRRLFEGLGSDPPEVVVVNLDDPWGKRLLDLPSPRRITFGLGPDAEVNPKRWTQQPDGLRVSVTTPKGQLEIASPLVGRANLANLLAAIAASLGLGVPGEAIVRGVADLKQVPGRFEQVDEGQPFLVVVDYAHTDDALANVLSVARELASKRLIVVFGCGGERDRTKRPLMGEVAGSMSDLAILTSDNPRGEDPLRIMSDALVGLQKTGKPYIVEVDRGAAIRKALGAAGPGDVVVLAGKGHETYQVLKDRTIPFDDREVARKILQGMEYGLEAGGDPSLRSG